jgi:hypothetical protein
MPKEAYLFNLSRTLCKEWKEAAEEQREEKE